MVRRNHPEGFTLLELLVALSIFAAVISMVYVAYRSTFRITRDSEAKLHFSNMARVALDRITEDLQTLYTGTGGYMLGSREEGKTGRADQLVFTSTSHLALHDAELPAGYALLHYSLEPDEESGLLRLYRSDRPALPGVPPDKEESGKGDVLCEELAGIEFKYIDGRGTGDDAWQSHGDAFDWNDELIQGKYPSLIRITMQFAASADDGERISYHTAVALPPVEDPDNQ
jgi:prepilin-type N-terminal cleavage/methylation domain-containing protein